MCRALEMTLEEFREFNAQNNPNYRRDVNFKPVLPSPDTIYYKDFHFLEEPLINRGSNLNYIDFTN